MKKSIFFTAFLFLSVCLSYAQSNLKPSERVQSQKEIGIEFMNKKIFDLNTNHSNLDLPDKLKSFSILSLKNPVIDQIKSQKPEGLTITIPIGNNRELELDLVLSNFKTSDFKAVEMPSGKVINPSSNVLHYMGVVKGKESTSMTAISFLEDEVMGFVSVSGKGGNWVIGKLNKKTEHIVYNDLDVQDDFALDCGSLELNQILDEYKGSDLENNKSQQVNRCPRIFFDLNIQFVNSQGGSTNATNYLNGVFNQVATIYANENINVLMSGSQAWTSNQPFSYSQDQASDLQSYRSYRTTNSFNGDLGHLITNYGGGIAYLDALCNPSIAVGLSGLYGAYTTVPTYSWSVYVLTHELGHNLGSNHTQTCVWNGNNTRIDGCNIDPNDGSCPNPGIPANGGTIMSYCHLQSVGVNFSLGFGPQPGNLIRSRVSNSTCLTSCNVDDDDDDDDNGDDLCETAPDYNGSISYSIGDYVIYEGFLYQLTSSGWNQLQECDDDIIEEDLCATSPSFSASVFYNVGDYVVYDGYLFQFNGTGWDLIQECTDDDGDDDDEEEDLCETSPDYSSYVYYNVGDYVIYQGYLFQFNGTGWDLIQECGATQQNLCETSPTFSSYVYYNVGDYVVYQGNLFQFNGTGWDFIQSCTGETLAATMNTNTLPSPPPHAEVEIYPNPLNGDRLNVANLKGDIQHFAVLSLSGKTIKEGTFTGSSIDLPSNYKGTYIIVFTMSNGEVIRKKLVKL